MSLLIPSHALPPFSYLVPQHLSDEVRVGTAVVASLSGYSRLGIVVGFEREAGNRSLKEIRAVVPKLSLPENLVKFCGWVAGVAALPPHAVLRMALPPGLGIFVYEICSPAPNWPWKVGSTISRTTLRRTLGGEGLRAAERAGTVRLALELPRQRTVEWAVLEKSALVPRLGTRQRELLEVLTNHERGIRVTDLLKDTGARRDTLRRLVQRGVVRLEKRPEAAPIFYTRGSGKSLTAHSRVVQRALSEGGTWVWRIPGIHDAATVAAISKAIVRGGEQVLVLAPTVQNVERLVETLQDLLPAGLVVAPYHSGLNRSRAAVYEATRQGEVDVLVGTRTAVLLPMLHLGAVCVVDEPNEAHKGSSDYEGVPVHVRDLAQARGRIEDAPVFFFSPYPSLRLYAPESGAQRLPPIEPARWPLVSIIDMRGTGAVLSSELLAACRSAMQLGRRVGVLVNRVGGAASVSCNRCGYLWRCPTCDVTLKLYSTLDEGLLLCSSCHHKERLDGVCRECGSDRLGVAGLTVDKVIAELTSALGTEVGSITASGRDRSDAPIVVGTAHYIPEREWDLGVVPDADLLLHCGSVEKGFRTLFAIAEATRDRLLVQTRMPDHPALRAALQGDYAAFAATELPKRQALMYPPYAFLAEVVLKGSEHAVRHAVESELRPTLARNVEVLDPVPIPRDGDSPAWKILLRSRKRGALVRAAALVARLASESRGRYRLGAHINMDPEEV